MKPTRIFQPSWNTPSSASSRSPALTDRRPALLGVLGDPVSHSLSPKMHNAALRVLGLDSVYLPLHVSPSDFEVVIDAMRVLGGAGNATIPHKEALFRAASVAGATARTLGAANTFWVESGVVHCDNTDVDGFLDAVSTQDARGPWLLIGTGGAARAVALASSRAGVELMVKSRRTSRAGEFAAWCSDTVGARTVPVDVAEARTVVNTTPLGLLKTDPFPVDPEEMGEGALAVDLTYARGGTRWINECKNMGFRAMDGRAMLVAQGCRSFEMFFPGHRAPVDVMRGAVETALRA